jgi:hypothetical protein
MAQASGLGVLDDQGSQIDASWAIRGLAGQLGTDIGAHFVATATDAWAEVHMQFVGRETGVAQGTDSLVDDLRGGATPARMEDGDGP